MPRMDIESASLQLKSAAWDHILTEHGMEAAQADQWGWRKSHWYSTKESDIKGFVELAFDAFRQEAIRGGEDVSLTVDNQNRHVTDQDIGRVCGTRGGDEPTSSARLVLRLSHSGDAHVVTAFPV